jgi:hypothetical protein
MDSPALAEVLLREYVATVEEWEEALNVCLTKVERVGLGEPIGE